MSKLLIISPVHIGSGEVYENFLIHKNKRYGFEDFLNMVFKERRSRLMSPDFLKSLVALGYRNSGGAKRKIREVLVPNEKQIEQIEPLYDIEIKLDRQQLNEKSIFSFVKTMHRPYIPGSSIKGYIMNMLFYDMLENDQTIRNYIKSQLEAAVNQSQGRDITRTRVYRDYENLERNVMTDAAQCLICRDFMFDQPMSIYYVSRQTKKGEIPQVAECLDDDIESSEDIIVIHDQKVEKRFGSSIQDKMTEALIERIKRLRKDFAKMNTPFIKNTLGYQKRFIESHRNNNKINYEEVMDQIRYTEERLVEGRIVIQIGKYTNYITKSSSMALGLDFYERYFRQAFRPDRKTKLFEIGSMNLAAYPKDYQDFDQIPGYMMFEW
jgi:CRISPR-associated protein Csm5